MTFNIIGWIKNLSNLYKRIAIQILMIAYLHVAHVILLYFVKRIQEKVMLQEMIVQFYVSHWCRSF